MPSRLTVVLVSLLLATPAGIFWLWLMILPSRVALLCPEGCRCEKEGYYVNCSDAGLNRFPSILSRHARELVLDGNRLTCFENDIFISKGLVDLRILKADYCKIRRIELCSFNGLTKLTHLSMKDNEISEIIPGTFETISRLVYLDLGINIVEHLETDVFNGLVKVKYIDLVGNKLQYLHPDTFVRLPNLQSLFLSNNPGLQIPIGRHFINSHSLTQLCISGCNVRSVSVETFANVSALERLDLSYNNLRSIDMNILKVLPELSVLNLRRNWISEIIPGTFEKFSRLEYLHLDHNMIEHLESGVLYWLVELKAIHLEGNRLQYLHPDTFLGLPNLQRLYLSKTSGLQIPTDRHFINSHSLKYLDISRCNVSSVSFETFANVSALERLDLSYNNLRSVEINISKSLPKLSTLYLYGNPLQCDCQLQEMWRLCQDHNIQTAYKETAPECDTPSEVEGMWWGVLEKGHCLQGNIHYYGDYKNTSYSYTPIVDIDTETEQGKNVSCFLKQYEAPVSAVLFIFGTTSNLILIIIITCNKDMRTVPNMYILNVAVSDMIILTIQFFYSCTTIIPYGWYCRGVMSTFLPFCNRMSVGLTTYSIAVFSIQRYRVTVNPLHVLVSSQLKWLATVVIICGVWIVAALFAIPAARSQIMCVESLWLLLTKYNQRVVIFHLLVSCVIPLCVITFSYVMTARHLVESSCSLTEETQNSRLNTRKNSAKVVLGLTVVFLISYVPYHVLETYMFSRLILQYSSDIFSDEFRWLYKLGDINVILHNFLSINSCLNPVALFCISRVFRRQFKRYLTCCCKANSPPTDIELTSIN